MKQLLADAWYDYEPKPRKDGDEIWTPCGQDVPKEPKPISEETKESLRTEVHYMQEDIMGIGYDTDEDYNPEIEN